MTHSFAVFRYPTRTAHTDAFDEWAVATLDRADVDALSDYRAKGPGVAAVHPTADQYVPLLVTVGAASDPGSAVSAIDRMVLGNVTRSLQLT